jgi:hypothetical protein
MVTTLFTSQSYIERYTPIGTLVSWDEIEPTVYLVQDNNTQDLLGTNFYNYLQIKYQAQTLNTAETELVNRIKPFQAHKVAEQCVPMINYQMKNKGLMTQNGDYSTSADLETVRYIKNEMKQRAEFFAQRVLNYLCENASDFPEYTSDNSTDMKPNQSGNGYDNGGIDFV